LREGQALGIKEEGERRQPYAYAYVIPIAEKKPQIEEEEKRREESLSKPDDLHWSLAREKNYCLGGGRMLLPSETIWQPKKIFGGKIRERLIDPVDQLYLMS